MTEKSASLMGIFISAAASEPVHAPVPGSILYRLVYALVLYTKVVPVDCLKLVTALVVALAIAAPSIRQWWAFQTRKRRALAGRKGEK